MKHIKKINEDIEKRIVLTEEDFKSLISGGIVNKDGVKIILQDIGYDSMINIIMQMSENERLTFK